MRLQRKGWNSTTSSPLKTEQLSLRSTRIIRPSISNTGLPDTNRSPPRKLCLPSVHGFLQPFKAERGVSFEDVVYHIMAGDILETIDHPNQDRYPGQQIHVVAIEEYVYLVPFVESEDEVFLKTILPSGKASKTYLGGGK